MSFWRSLMRSSNSAGSVGSLLAGAVNVCWVSSRVAS